MSPSKRICGPQPKDQAAPVTQRSDTVVSTPVHTFKQYTAWLEGLVKTHGMANVVQNSDEGIFRFPFAASGGGVVTANAAFLTDAEEPALRAVLLKAGFTQLLKSEGRVVDFDCMVKYEIKLGFITGFSGWNPAPEHTSLPWTIAVHDNLIYTRTNDGSFHTGFSSEHTPLTPEHTMEIRSGFWFNPYGPGMVGEYGDVKTAAYAAVVNVQLLLMRLLTEAGIKATFGFRAFYPPTIHNFEDLT